MRNWVLAFTFVFFTHGANAALPPYQLVQFENGDFKDQDRAALMARLHMSEADFVPYRCDGKSEFEILPKFAHPNRKADSLHLKASLSNDVLIYRNGLLLGPNGKKPKVDPRQDPFVRDVMESLSKLETLPTGNALLRRLERSPYPLTIARGDPRFAPADDTGKPFTGLPMAQVIQIFSTLRRADYGEQFSHVGAGGTIFFNPALRAEFVESDGRKRPVLPHVVLAHEMFHSFDGVRGLLDRRLLDGTEFEFIEITEYRATFMENRIREESGLRYRKYYGDGTDGRGSLLGNDGKPMLIPATCFEPFDSN